jgi:D-sedoheptulose 7-phosphate isomerase
MNKKQFIIDNFEESINVKSGSLAQCTHQLIEASTLVVGSFRNRGKLLICGNGGSAADAQHYAAELIVRLSHDIERPGLPAVALTTDSSILTAGGNDIGFDNIFARQVEALGNPEDVLLVISTSGNSKNILNALQITKEKNLKSIGFLGSGGGKCKDIVDIPIIVSSDNTQRIQETHLLLGHILLELIEREMYS